ncbi:hypothetical protein BASA61_007772 [Batrachochytrium salamandrivorans]|nr:hypothetical protein BASA61_007772 [Batrachochytrium salamandrivorans]
MMSTPLPPLPSLPGRRRSHVLHDIPNDIPDISVPTATGAPASFGNRLSATKAQAYISIFEDALDQLAVLGDITPEALKTDNKQLSEKISRILFEQRTLQEKYQELLLEQNQYHSPANKLKLKDNQVVMAEVRNSYNQIHKAHPSVAQNLLKIQQERSALQSLLSRSIRELRNGRFDSLASTVEDEYKKRNTLQHTIDRENDASDMLKELQLELANEKKLIQDEISDRNQVIQQLKDTIQEINALTASEQKYIKKEVKAHENSVRLQCTKKETELCEAKLLLQKRLDQEQLAHDKIVDFLGHQRRDLEGEIQKWMIKYEEDTEAKAAELEALKLQRSQDLDRFEELAVSYEALEKMVDEDKLASAKEAEDLRLQQAYSTASIKIQRWYRKRKEQRALLMAAKAPTKSGKGSKIKGKGKKK